MSNLADAFASTFFFRILLPGLVLTGVVHPFLAGTGFPGAFESTYSGGVTLLLVEVAVFGLIAYAATIPVYHILFGARLPRLTVPVRKFTKWRVNRKIAKLQGLYGESSYADLDKETKRKASLLHDYLHDFPLGIEDDGSKNYRMPSPTRLGCIIDGYIYYPETRYGIDVNHFWHHIDFLFPAEIRKELDGVEAIAQGMVLSAAASWIGFSLAVLALVLSWLGESQSLAFLPPAPASSTLLILMLASLFAVSLFTALAREAHREYGRFFRAAFDVHSLDVARWVDGHKMPFADILQLRAQKLARWANHFE